VRAAGIDAQYSALRLCFFSSLLRRGLGSLLSDAEHLACRSVNILDHDFIPVVQRRRFNTQSHRNTAAGPGVLT